MFNSPNVVILYSMNIYNSGEFVWFSVYFHNLTVIDVIPSIKMSKSVPAFTFLQIKQMVLVNYEF